MIATKADSTYRNITSASAYAPSCCCLGVTATAGRMRSVPVRIVPEVGGCATLAVTARRLIFRIFRCPWNAQPVWHAAAAVAFAGKGGWWRCPAVHSPSGCTQHWKLEANIVNFLSSTSANSAAFPRRLLVVRWNGRGREFANASLTVKQLAICGRSAN